MLVALTLVDRNPTVTTVVAERSYAAPLAAESADSSNRRRGGRRITSLDVIRGVVMILMAIDHVRVYSGQPPGGPTPGIFFTRWVTNFCAPAFVLLAGTGAWLYRESRGGDAARRTLGAWLVTRGLWLVLLELTLLRFAWTFNFDYAHSAMAGVIWCIGWCMVGLAALQYLPMSVVLGAGVVIVAGHNLLDGTAKHLAETGAHGPWIWILQILYFGGVINVGSLTFGVLYSLIPWVGVMALGFALGPVMKMDASRRARLCLTIGGGAVVAFMVLRGFNLYGDPRPWHNGPRMPGFLSFLATTKYPASLQFLLMTLGPTLLAIPLLEQASGPIIRLLTIFGRVPFFYYVLHIPLIHLTALGVSLIRLGRVSPWLFANHPMLNPPPPEGYTWDLATLYAVWLIVLVPLYFACRWYAALKARSRNPLLSYL